MQQVDCFFTTMILTLNPRRQMTLDALMTPLDIVLIKCGIRLRFYCITFLLVWPVIISIRSGDWFPDKPRLAALRMFSVSVTAGQASSNLTRRRPSVVAD